MKDEGKKELSMENERSYWLTVMRKIADPVLLNLEKETLIREIPTDFHPDRKLYIALEAFGRTLQGIAPWLEVTGLTGSEAAEQEKMRFVARRALENAVNPASPDYMNFSGGYGQPLVDAAFLSHAVVRAPRELYEKLSPEGKKNLAAALRATRRFTPFYSNWLLFSAMVEAALCVMGEEDYDLTRVAYAVTSMENWYAGDGAYGDGPHFHWDYYNSFVIHPMLVDVLRVFRDKRPEFLSSLEKATARGARYAAVEEELINADGSYPVFGRSTTYRFGAFHALAQAALEGYLPEGLSPARVRSALTAVIRKVTENEETFDEKGWLTPGVYGRQPDLAEEYISVGSLYLSAAVFLPLGLLPDHPFWKGEAEDWTAKLIWSGKNVTRDHAVD